MKTKNTGVRFIIETDIETNRECWPDINYKNTQKLFDEELVLGKVWNVKVPLKDVKTLIISAVASAVNIDGQERYLFPNIVIAEPSLMK